MGNIKDILVLVFQIATHPQMYKQVMDMTSYAEIWEESLAEIMRRNFLDPSVEKDFEKSGDLVLEYLHEKGLGQGAKDFTRVIRSYAEGSEEIPEEIIVGLNNIRLEKFLNSPAPSPAPPKV